MILHKYLAQCLRAQNKYGEAKEAMKHVEEFEENRNEEKKRE